MRRILAQAVTRGERRADPARSRPAACTAMLIARMAGCVFSVSSSRSSGPSKHNALSDSPSAASASSNAARQSGKVVGKDLAHADLLRTLSGKHKRNHRMWSFVASRRDAVRDSFSISPSAHESRRHRDGIANRLGRRAAMTDDAQAIQADERRAAVLGGVDALAKSAERLSRQQVADARAERRRQLVVQQALDRLDQPLADLQRHVAGESVADDHVDVAGVHVTAFDVADELDRGRLQQLMRVARQLVALALFARRPTAARLAATRQPSATRA